jgi:murein L,D-transpeptidase YcbB/YkuD
VRTPGVYAFWGWSLVAAATLATGAPAPSFAQAAEAEAAVSALSWQADQARDLLALVKASAGEGLTPSEYSVDALAQAIEAGDRVAVNHAATMAALKLATDYRFGRTPTADRVDWHLGDKPNPSAMMPLIGRALAEGRVREAIEGLLPRSAEYKALKAALVDAKDPARRDRLRVNLDRWRWMPRELSGDHVFVNVPEYRVRLVKGGEVVAEHDAIVGKPSSPTPAFASEIEAVSLNPTWAVPPSLKAQKLSFIRRNPKAAKRMGYSVKYDDGGVSIFQRPGPANAMGQMKLVMPNQWDIYLHDTSEPELFGGQRRTLSAGCVRVDRPIELVGRILAESESQWDEAQVESVLSTRRQARADLGVPLPVYVTYFTAAPDATGGVKLLPDPYNRDARVLRALGGKPAARVQTAGLK